MNKEQITSRQVAILSFFLSRSLFLLFGFSYLFSLSKNDILVVIPLGTLLGTILLLFYLSIQNDLKQQNIFEKIKVLFPKPISLWIQITLFTCLLFLSCFLLFTITTYINYSLVPKISMFIVSTTFLILIYNITMKGIETIVRSSEIFFYIFIILVSISFIGLGKYIELNQIRPFFSNGLFQIIKSIIVYTSLSTGPLFLFTIIPKKNIINPKVYQKRMLQSYLFTSFIIWIFAFLSISILGIELLMIYSYPSTIILKKVTFLKIIERLESILSIHWLFDLVLLLAMIFLVLKEGTKTIFSIYKEKKVSLAMIFISVFVLLGSNYIPHETSYYTIMFFIVTIIIPIVIWSKLKLQKTRKKKETIF